MAGFNFSKIAGVFSAMMDSDNMDIYKKTPKTNADGSKGETEVARALNVPCHVSFDSKDEARQGIDVSAVVLVVTIHCSTSIVIQNDDYVVARKCDSAGNVMETYSGVVGFHAVDQARQSVKMTVRKSV